MQTSAAMVSTINAPLKTHGCRHGAGPGAVAGLALLSLMLGMGAPRAARAQGAFDMGMLTNTLSQGGSGRSGGDRRGARTHGGASLKSALTHTLGVKGVSDRTSAVAFTPSAAVRKRDIERFLSRVQRTDPQAAASLRSDFATKDVFGTLARKLTAYGLKTNSVTDAFTIYTIVAWHGVHGDNDDPEKAHVRGVRAQMGRALAGVPSLTTASDARKQEVADAFILQAVLIDAYVAGAKLHPEKMPQAKAALALGTAATLGFDLTAFKLTDHGLSL